MAEEAVPPASAAGAGDGAGIAESIYTSEPEPEPEGEAAGASELLTVEPTSLVWTEVGVGHPLRAKQ